MVGRLVHTADFQRVLAAPPRSRSAHFAVHYVNSRPAVFSRRPPAAAEDKLSTGAAPDVPQPVDDSPAGHWLGTVVPKRLARRSVTRNLIKRQMRCAMQAHSAALPPGLWVLKLRSPFAREQFVSAASNALRQAAGAELGQLLARAAG